MKRIIILKFMLIIGLFSHGQTYTSNVLFATQSRDTISLIDHSLDILGLGFPRPTNYFKANCLFGDPNVSYPIIDNGGYFYNPDGLANSFVFQFGSTDINDLADNAYFGFSYTSLDFKINQLGATFTTSLAFESSSSLLRIKTESNDPAIPGVQFDIGNQSITTRINDLFNNIVFETYVDYRVKAGYYGAVVPIVDDEQFINKAYGDANYSGGGGFGSSDIGTDTVYITANSTVDTMFLLNPKFEIIPGFWEPTLFQVKTEAFQISDGILGSFTNGLQIQRIGLLGAPSGINFKSTDGINESSIYTDNFNTTLLQSEPGVSSSQFDISANEILMEVQDLLLGEQNSRIYVTDLGVEIESTAAGEKINITETRVNIEDVLNLKPIATAPASPGAGDMYFNSTDNTGYMFDGSIWQSLW